KSTACVTCGQAQEQPGIRVYSLAHEPPFERPMRHPHTGIVARTDHHIMSRHAGKQGWDIARVMAEIGIHVKYEFIVVLHGIAQPRDRRGSESKLACAVQHMDTRICNG